MTDLMIENEGDDPPLDPTSRAHQGVHLKEKFGLK